MIPSTMITSVLNSFEGSKYYTPFVPKSLWRVKINGDFIATSSGKTVWKRIGDAKNAVILHIDNIVRYHPGQQTGYHSAKKVLQHLIDNNMIEFVEIPTEFE